MGAARAEIDICRYLTYSRGSSISHHPLIHLLSQGWKSHWLLHYNHNKVKRKLIELHNGQALNGPSLLIYNASELDVKDQSVRVSWLNTHLNIDQSMKKFIFQKPRESCFRDSFNADVHLTATCLLKDSYRRRAIAHCRLNESHSFPQYRAVLFDGLVWQLNLTTWNFFIFFIFLEWNWHLISEKKHTQLLLPEETCENIFIFSAWSSICATHSTTHYWYESTSVYVL